MDVDLNDLPKMRYYKQKWVLYNMESPANTEHLRKSLQNLQENIDWMLTYRRDSDIYSPYGYTKANTRPKNISLNLTNKKREVAWFVSNCDTPGKREDFVRELAKYVEIDIYGNCGDFKCDKSSYYKCLEMVETNYKFYLSFENSLCKDYVTEKLFRVMSYNVIPIVFGGAEYREILPPNSFIDALAFKNPRELSVHLKEISNNLTLQMKYFEWKRYYSIVDNISNGLCLLCDKLIETNLNSQNGHHTTKLKRDLIKWWFDDANCTSWSSL
ncbi:alpha-(1:3)-fucosyltransferase 9-like protein [Dinothrombium tinctorium]|uniref:Fucosyltransferase n=1 Tax=Dinothrombium tinctorium TaxID=1965070 RepID=A0A443QP28_9ACAR|nr:alpha-(1:3)-fucosyltransferase 9-like protein [Dinothrombium tinctorium]